MVAGRSGKEQFMKIVRASALVAVGFGMLMLAGCGTNIPPRVEVRDVGSGRTYQTYQPWGQIEKGVGYTFTDIETGRKITLTNYELRTLEGQKTVAGDSPEAKSFETAKARGGVK
jgi:hypothetical protein